MKLDFNDMLFAFSDGLDCIERGLAGVTDRHSKRVAYMISRMGKIKDMEQQYIWDLAGCALLHDNALTEYILEEFQGAKDNVKKKNNLGIHCMKGEDNIKNIPFQSDISGNILYHHEKADGTGPFLKTEKETPLGAQMIHLADMLDVSFMLDKVTEEKWEKIEKYLKRQKGRQFSEQVIELFFEAFSFEELRQLNQENLSKVLRNEFPEASREYDDAQILDFCNMFARIIDYKSEFTSRHSLGIAQKARAMGEYYGYGKEVLTKLYLAGAVHDIGKLMVDTDILEKPDRLTQEEYRHIQNHAMGTYVILSQIRGLDDVVSWASLHHEKLNGKGYPFGKTAKELGKMERLMACIDIYQALTEERPYKAGMHHKKAMDILRSMAEKGELDGEIVSDIDKTFG